MKAILFIFAIYVLLSPVIHGSMVPNWWNNPHAALFNLKQGKIFEKESKSKPNLSLIKENLYLPLEFSLNNQSYRGLITLKPQSSGHPKVGGAFFKDPKTDQLSLLDGDLIDKETHFEVRFRSRNASQLFQSKKLYQENIDFPLQLEIRNHYKNNKPYLIAPIVKEPRHHAKFFKLEDGLEKEFVGKWQSHGEEGSWEFDFTTLPGHQITGVAHLETREEFKCAYPMFGFPVGRNVLAVLTGESTINTEQCGTYAWYGTKDTNQMVTFDPIGHRNYALSLLKK